MPGRISGVSFIPLYLSSAGLGSNVSIWLIPPCVTSRMIDFALAGSAAGRGASPSVIADSPPRAHDAARAARPAPRTVRRETSMPCGFMFVPRSSVEIDKLVGVQHHVTKVHECARIGIGIRVGGVALAAG